MILLVSMSSKAEQCARALEAALRMKVERAASVERAAPRLRAQEYAAVVVDALEAERDPDGADMLLAQVGSAATVVANFALSSAERIVREVNAAMRRQERHRKATASAACAALRNDLNETVTGILLSSELALQVPALPAAAEAKLRSVRELAVQLRQRLQA